MNRRTRTISAVVLAAAVLLAGAYVYYQRSASATFINTTPSNPLSDIGLRIDPTGGSVFAGDTFDVSVLLDSPTKAISAVGTKVNYSSNLEYVSSSVVGSIFDTQVSNAGDANGVSAANGSLTFSRLRTDTGYKGTGGIVMKLTFKTLTTGTYTVQVDQANSEVTAYDNSLNAIRVVGQGSYTSQNKQVKTTVLMPLRTDLSASNVAVKIYNAGTTTLAASTSTATVSSAGVLSLADPSVTSVLSDTQTYDVKISVPGYLTRKIPSVTRILSTPFAFSTDQALIPGDYDGNNKVTLNDLVTAIRAYNNTAESTTTLVKQTAGATTLPLSFIVTLIRTYNSTPIGD